eukprot:447533-Amphidinium_carterae.3
MNPSDRPQFDTLCHSQPIDRKDTRDNRQEWKRFHPAAACEPRFLHAAHFLSQVLGLPTPPPLNKTQRRKQESLDACAGDCRPRFQWGQW